MSDFRYDLGPLDVAAGATEEVPVRLGWRSVDIHFVMARDPEHFAMRVRIRRKGGSVVENDEKLLASYKTREVKHCEVFHSGDEVHFIVRNVTDQGRVFDAAIFGRGTTA